MTRDIHRQRQSPSTSSETSTPPPRTQTRENSPPVSPDKRSAEHFTGLDSENIRIQDNPTSTQRRLSTQEKKIISSPQKKSTLVLPYSPQKTNEFGLQSPRLDAASLKPVCISPQQLKKIVEDALPEFIKNHHYDRISYVEKLYDYCNDAKFPLDTSCDVNKLFSSFSARSRSVFQIEGNGHCGALALGFKEVLPKHIKKASFLSASKIKTSLSIKGGPEFDHSALLIKFINKDNISEHGYVVVDPSFDFAHAPVVSNMSADEFKYSMVGKDEVWQFSLSHDSKHIVCQPRPASASSGWIPDQEYIRKQTIYTTSHLKNVDGAITHPIIVKDIRPVMISRICGDKPRGVIAIQFAKKTVSIRLGGTGISLPFSAIVNSSISNHSWIIPFQAPLEACFQMPAEKIAQKIAKSVRMVYVIEKAHSSIQLSQP